jgi:protein tyrosine phosphatase (PTP) superfamily phosphohydrolase (DUF442 family)
MCKKNSVALLMLLGSGFAASAQESAAQETAPRAATAEPLAANYVVIDKRIHTAGQPSAETLAGLADYGFDLVVNLAPPSSQGAVAEEGSLVAAAGALYVNIPVNWQQPTAEEFDRFSAVMNEAREEKVLVHCQLNMRASAFTFIYRVVHEGVSPEAALVDLRKVWLPNEQWAEFVNSSLASHAIGFRLPDPE